MEDDRVSRVEVDEELEKILEKIVLRLYGEGGEVREGDEDLPVELILDGKKLDELVCKYPVVVAVFTSPTCPACEMYRPIFYAYAAKASKTLGEKVKFVEIDVYHATEKAWELGVMGTPTTLLFHKCRVVDGLVGLVDEETLDELLAQHTGLTVFGRHQH